MIVSLSFFYHIITSLESPSPFLPFALASPTRAAVLRGRRCYAHGDIRATAGQGAPGRYPAAGGIVPPLPVGRGQRLCPRRGNDAMSLSANALCRPAPSSVGAPIKRGPGLFPAPPGAAGAQSAHKAGAGAFGPRPCFGFAGPPGRQNTAAPRAVRSFSAARAHLPPPLLRPLLPPAGREKTMRPAPLRSGCPRRSQSAIIGSHCDLPSPTVARIWRSPARPPGAQHVCNRMGKPSVLFFPGEIAQGHGQMPIICNKQKPRSRKAGLATTGLHRIQGALFGLL